MQKLLIIGVNFVVFNIEKCVLHTIWIFKMKKKIYVCKLNKL
jgi:hypothetical protein